MDVSPVHRLTKILLRAGFIYAVLFVLWLVVAPYYHLLLAKSAGVLIPVFSRASVERIWLDDRKADEESVGARFRVTVSGRDSSYDLTPTQRVEATMDTVVDIRQFGYPILTLLALSLGISPPRRLSDARRILLGAFIVFAIYSLWVVVEVYESLAAHELEFLRHNLIARILPPHSYQQYRIPLIVYLGQLIPAGVFFAVYLPEFLSGRLFRPKRRARAV